ncbi:hypothetical protein VN97_g12278 [Penicillium thymicola]|uniref:Uncharacterized protein n=1 Tax=Penicillium thymicola TaxID=293382 RepID=A0AAI9T5T6_PENTH|nr:hypothetical protein VN97_g12278 [Penicillium thymicola]
MEDPGPSVRARTAAELTALIEDQVEDASFPGLDINGLPLLRNFITSLDKKFRDLYPERTELDWKNGTRHASEVPSGSTFSAGTAVWR